MTTTTLSYYILKNKAISLKFPVILVNWRIVFVICLILSSILLVLYVFQVHTIINNTYSLSGYQKQIADLSKENKKLEISFAESNFLESVRAKSEVLNFEKTKKVTYIQILDNSLAKGNEKME